MTPPPPEKKRKFFACREWEVGEENEWWVALYKDVPFGKKWAGRIPRDVWRKIGGKAPRRGEGMVVSISVKVIL